MNFDIYINTIITKQFFTRKRRGTRVADQNRSSKRNLPCHRFFKNNVYTKHSHAMPPTRLVIVLFVFIHRAMIAVVCVAMLFNVSFALMSVQRVLPTLWIGSSCRKAISTVIGKNIKKKKKESQKYWRFIIFTALQNKG